MSDNVIHRIGELPAAVTYVQVVSAGDDRVELRAADDVVAVAFRHGVVWVVSVITHAAENLSRFLVEDSREAVDALRQIGALYFDMRTGARS
ncbi:hypothetical protein [Mycobacteroides chelonae]|jgi:hypothetical protein|uniref:hypothetical protein n=1 Tax=Mycobacteroides chelonae TaxID=1774 RepID=UPI0008A9B756|nr:hypothetical protein [Mycobacteroides chelonae]MBF9326046.1 hypothetical protein [Mycobacteroides chelonae]MBF9420222.1 hypothetical protein [Mycobacteroides chelonae]MBF9438690.1 hypothetical protein [Mycobacteroides chelonae]MBV6359999.1 hypothetical protein [Mycobacteroides chelonae]MEC4834396.1 hypothetical protein [Mycobacteroides chelonae]